MHIPVFRIKLETGSPKHRCIRPNRGAIISVQGDAERCLSIMRTCWQRTVSTCGSHRIPPRVKDIGQVLEHPRRVAVTSDNERVAYDASCHLLHGQHAAEESLGMLRS